MIIKIFILFSFFSCKTVETKFNLDPVFKSEFSTYIGSEENLDLNEKFSRTYKSLKNEKYSLKKINGSDRTFYFQGDIEAFTKKFKGYDLELDINHYIYQLPKNIGEFEFPENIIFKDKKDTVVFTYDFKTKQFLEIFRIDDYDFNRFESYCRIFKDLHGYTTFMLNQDLNYIDVTPFQNRTSFCIAKIGFRKTDFLVNKGYITEWFINKEISGMYSSIFLDSSLNKYELPLLKYIIKTIEEKIDTHQGKSYSMFDFFFDEYEETPYFFLLKKHLFDLAIKSIDILENLTKYHLGEYKVANPYVEEQVKKADKGITEKQKKDLVIVYDKECRALFKLLNESLDKFMKKENFNTVKAYVLETLTKEKDFVHFKKKKNKNLLIKYIKFISDISSIKELRNA